MRKELRLTLMLLFTFILPFRLEAQLNYAGKNFFVTLGGDGMPMHGNVRIILSGKHHANVQFRYANTFWGPAVQNYIVTPGATTIVDYNNFQLFQISNFQLEQPDNKSLQIVSDSNIAVTLVVMDGCADDGTPVLPVDNQVKATKYFLLSLSKEEGAASYGHYSFSMVATCDSTLLQITPTTPTATHPANVPFTVWLNKGQTYQLSTDANSMPGELSGTEIKVLQSRVNIPISVFCTFHAIYNPIAHEPPCCADALFEQILPVENWDTLVPIVSMYQDKIRIKVLSSGNNNQVYFDNTPIISLGRAEAFDTVIDINGGIVIRADKPIAVGEFMLSDSWDGIMGDGDPDMLWSIAPWRGCRESYFQLQTAGNPLNDTTHKVRLRIITPAANVNNIMLDNISIAAAFTPFPNDPAWQSAVIRIDSADNNTVHHLVSGEKVTAFLVKVYRQGGYSYNLSDAIMDSLSAFGNNNLVTDSVYKCKGDPVTLYTGNHPPYQWSTGATASSISVVDTGYYWVKEMQPQACDTMLFLHQFHVIDTQNQQSIGNVLFDTVYKCPEQSIMLEAQNALRYLWNTGEVTRSIVTNSTGPYWVREFLTDEPCKATYTDHHFAVEDFTLHFNLGPDTTACENEYVSIVSGFPATIWSTGDTAAAIRVIEEGTYTATYTDSCGRVHVDSITVHYQFCPDRFCTIEFPNAFSPNGDGRNDLFRAITYGEFTSYNLSVYNRWGQLVYQTYKINEGWDGTFQGEPAEVGTYMFYCITHCPKKGEQFIKGDIVLIR